MERELDYPKVLQGILDIGEAMMICGAEVSRAEDSIYRMCRAYGFVRCDVFVIVSNLQATIETKDGEIITQIRFVSHTSTNYDRLDYLNNLSRYVAHNTPDHMTINRKFEEVMNRDPQPKWMTILAGIMGGAGFSVFFGCNPMDTIVAVIASVLVVLLGFFLANREENPFVYNFVIMFLVEVYIILSCHYLIGDHPGRITIGVVMLLISGLGTTNGFRDMLHKDIFSGFLNILNSMLGAAALATGIALAMLLLKGGSSSTMYMAPSVVVQLISCTIACTGFAIWFGVKGVQIFYCGLGAFFTWGSYVLVYHFDPSNFAATLVGAMFVAWYAIIMAKVNKAPATIFLTSCAFPLIPGPNLYYMMYGIVKANAPLAINQTLLLFSTCIGIALGFIVIDIVYRYYRSGILRIKHIQRTRRKIARARKLKSAWTRQDYQEACDDERQRRRDERERRFL